jgi:hypothetical protein
MKKFERSRQFCSKAMRMVKNNFEFNDQSWNLEKIYDTLQEFLVTIGIKNNQIEATSKK